MQAIKDALWAFATINYLPSTSFLYQCAAHCLKQLPAFNPQNIANVAWAYAKFGYEPAELFKALATDVRSCSQNRHYILSFLPDTKVESEESSCSLVPSFPERDRELW